MTRLRDLSARIEGRQARIGVMGLGYVGLPLAVEFAKAGFPVTGFELDAEKVRAIRTSKTCHRATSPRCAPPGGCMRPRT